jgi:AbrB family looped-hinge helix DNA binding protein
MPNRSIVGPKGQITIPKSLRERYHLLEGEEVVLVERAEGVLVRHPPSALRGRLRGQLDTDGLEKDIEKVRKQWKA